MEATVTVIKRILNLHVFIPTKPYVDRALKDVLEKDPLLLLSAQGEAKDRVQSLCIYCTAYTDIITLDRWTQPMNMEVKEIVSERYFHSA
jgi:hypothetical protein